MNTNLFLRAKFRKSENSYV